MDIESAADKTGFPALARKIAINPDYEAFIFRKFDRLSARNLLHLESRLAYLEFKLNKADELAANSRKTETLRSIRTWEAFEDLAKKDEAGPEHARMRIAEEIREVLKEYQEALLRQNQISTLEGPRKRALEVVCRHESMLAGLAKERLHQRNHRDLAAVRRPVDKDLLSRFLQDHWMFKTTRLTEETEYIREDHVAWVVGIVNTIIAAILLIGAIGWLHFLDGEKAQLGVISMFTVLFASSIKILTNARRTEIFASTAAYAAVLVVFISSSPSSSGTVSCKCVPAD